MQTSKSSVNLALCDRIDTVGNTAIRQGKVVGSVVAVAYDGNLIYERAFGFADRENNKKTQCDTLCRLASRTKALVSAVTLALCETGRLSLSDPVTKYLPEFLPKLTSGSSLSTVPEINIWHLLTHTAGLGYGFNLPPNNEPYVSLGISDGLDSPSISLEENLRRLTLAPLFFAPGSAWSYSLATDVLGAVLEASTKRSLPDVVHTFVTGPLKMTDTSFSVKDASRLALAYADAEKAGQPARLMPDPYSVHKAEASIVHFSPGRIFDQNQYKSGGAGMVGTARDYLLFLEAIRTGGGPILNTESVRLMVEDQIPALKLDEPGMGFSLGFGIVRDPVLALTPKNAGTFGWGGIYGTAYWVDPVSKLSVVALTNTTLEGVDGKFRVDLANAIYGVSDVSGAAIGSGASADCEV